MYILILGFGIWIRVSVYNLCLVSNFLVLSSWPWGDRFQRKPPGLTRPRFGWLESGSG